MPYDNGCAIFLGDEAKTFLITVDHFVGHAIQMTLRGERKARPLTHDLIKSVLDRLNGTLDRVVIDDLWNTTYYAKLYLKVGKEEIEIDARPSDSIAIAVRSDAPIFVSDGILDRKSVV